MLFHAPGVELTATGRAMGEGGVGDTITVQNPSSFRMINGVISGVGSLTKLGVGNLILPNTFYDPGSAFDSRQSAWTTADVWMGFLAGFLPSAITFVYMPDEPSSSEYPRIRTISDNIKSDPKVGHNLPIFVTKEWVPELDGAIDIWTAAPSTYQISRAAAERQKGHRYWTYNGGRPFAPAIVIEASTASTAISTGTPTTGCTTRRSRTTACRTCGAIRSPTITACLPAPPATSPTATAC